MAHQPHLPFLGRQLLSYFRAGIVRSPLRPPHQPPDKSSGDRRGRRIPTNSMPGSHHQHSCWCSKCCSFCRVSLRHVRRRVLPAVTCVAAACVDSVKSWPDCEEVERKNCRATAAEWKQGLLHLLMFQVQIRSSLCPRQQPVCTSDWPSKYSSTATE